MTELTKAEQTVFDSIMELCEWDYSAEVYEISEKTGMTKESVKGVVGSLTKKQMVICEREHRGDRVFHDIFPINANSEVFSNNEWK